MSNKSNMNKANLDTSLAALTLNRGGDRPLHAQIVEQLRRLILSGAAAGGVRLPSSRSLAAELSVSRITVTQAYDQLSGEGYLEGRPGAGMFVAEALPDVALQSPAPKPARHAKADSPKPYTTFQPGIPDYTLFPHAQFGRLLDRIWRAPSAGLLANPDPLGWGPLREAIAAHLAIWRGLDCSPDQVVITSGAADGFDLVARAIWRAEDEVIVETPGYTPMRDTLTRAGIRARAHCVDDQGLHVEAALAAYPKAAGAVVTPSRHYPTGATMPPQRRLALLEWAAEGRVIVEDDYDSEFRYQGAPLPSLASLDQGGAVIYLGSFSKVLSPALRIGFLVAPEALMPRISKAAARLGPRASLIPQPALAAFMESGDFARHIRRMRRAYSTRQKALLAALAAEAQGLLVAKPDPAGMHLIAKLTPDLAGRMTDRDVEARGAEAGVIARALSNYYTEGPPQQGLVLGYAGFDEAALAAGVAKLAAALR